MAKNSPGEMIYALRKKIQELDSDLKELGGPTSEIPELITSANLLRSNEYLNKANDKKTELITAYEKYSETLEKMLSSVFEIQNDLKEVLKEQSSLISSQRAKSKTKPKKSRKTKK